MPIIGVTPSVTPEGRYSLNTKYVSALTDQGATVLILPYDQASLAHYLHLLDGVMLTGGGDIDAGLFGQARHPKTEDPSPARDGFEIHLCKAALAANIPLLGICRGLQVMNVALGGDLHQHIDGDAHNGPERGQHVHSVNLEEGCSLAGILGAQEVGVNSIHHQCIGGRLGSGVSICGKSRDGVAEAIELPHKRFAIGVQWHPEELAPADTRQTALFAAFVNASRTKIGSS